MRRELGSYPVLVSAASRSQTMKQLGLFVGTLLLASSCAAQNEAPGKSLVERCRLAKITLVDAVQRASKALEGQVVGAMLDVGSKEKPKAAYSVIVVHEGKLWTIDVDAQSGTVGKPREAADDDDDDERGEKAENSEMKKDEKADAGKGMVVQSLILGFEDVPVGELPKGWRAVETAGKGKLGTLRVEERADAPSGKRVLSLAATQNSGSTFNLALADAVLPADLALSVRIHANTGSEDQGGGLVWRAKDAGNYYLARWNPLEDNLRCYRVVGERRTMFQSGDRKVGPKVWHRLQVAMQGKACAITFDDKELLRFEDDTFTQPGRAGVWTKADAASSFDDFEAKGK
jgi:hypothetical protein